MINGDFTGTAVVQTRSFRLAMKIFEYWAFNFRISPRGGGGVGVRGGGEGGGGGGGGGGV